MEAYYQMPESKHMLLYSVISLVAQIFLLCFVFSQVSQNLREFDNSPDFSLT